MITVGLTAPETVPVKSPGAATAHALITEKRARYVMYSVGMRYGGRGIQHLVQGYDIEWVHSYCTGGSCRCPFR